MSKMYSSPGAELRELNKSRFILWKFSDLSARFARFTTLEEIHSTVGIHIYL